MVRTRKQGNEEENVNVPAPVEVRNDRDDRIDRLMETMERFMEQQLKAQMDRAIPPPPPPPAQVVHNEMGDAVGEKFLKYKPPTFEGLADTKVAENWVRTMERLFDCARIPQADRVYCAVMMLRDDASYWWDTMSAIHDINTMTWERFRQLLEEKFITSTVKEDKRREFANLTQGTMTVDEYLRKFDELIRYAPYVNGNEELKVERFVLGLNPLIQKDLQIADMDGASYTRMVSKALQIDRAEKKLWEFRKADREEQNRQRMSSGKGFQQKFQNRSKDSYQQQQQQQQPQRQFSQNQTGQKRQNNWRQNAAKKARAVVPVNQVPPATNNVRTACPNCGKFHLGECRQGVCYSCGKPGHFARDCRTNQGEQQTQ